MIFHRPDIVIARSVGILCIAAWVYYRNAGTGSSRFPMDAGCAWINRNGSYGTSLRVGPVLDLCHQMTGSQHKGKE